MHQTGRMAVAVYPDDGPGTGGTALARLGGGHAVDGQRGQRPGGRPALRGRSPPGLEAASRPARGGEPSSHPPVSAGLALGPRVPDDRPALPPALALGTGALARHPRMRGAAASVVA